jgi:hypothetical protein
MGQLPLVTSGGEHGQQRYPAGPGFWRCGVRQQSCERPCWGHRERWAGQQRVQRRKRTPGGAIGLAGTLARGSSRPRQPISYRAVFMAAQQREARSRGSWLCGYCYGQHRR